HVRAQSFEVASGVIATALDVLRVFQQSRASFRTTQFGLAGDAWSSQVPYVVLGDATGVGWKHRGHYMGAGVTPEQRDALDASAGFQFAARAIGEQEPSDGQRRALLGIR